MVLSSKQTTSVCLEEIKKMPLKPGEVMAAGYRYF
jgi:hypothetical protein